MKTWSLLLTALLASASLLSAQTQPVAPTPAAASVASTPAPTPASPAPAPALEVKIKEAPATAPAIKGEKDSTGRETLSVDFPDEDIRTILRNVADLFELNLVIPETLQGKTSVKLRDVTWRQIFQVVLGPVGYTYIEDGSIIKVVSNDSLQQEPTTTEVFILNYARAADIQATISSLVDTGAGGKLVIDARSNALVITERPSKLLKIRPIIESLDRATDQVMIESKFVEVTDTDVRNIGVNWSSLKNYKMSVTPSGQYTRTRDSSGSGGYDNKSTNTSGTTGSSSTTGSSTNSDSSTSSSTVTSTNGALTNTATSGVSSTLANSTGTSTDSTSTTGSDSTLSLLNSLTSSDTTSRLATAVFSADQFGVVLSALTELNRTKLVSNPTVVTLNNTEAIINVGQEYPIPNYTYNQQNGSYEVSGFTYKPIGVILRVTPQVNSRGFVKLTLEPEVSSISEKISFGGASGAQLPLISTRKAKTQVSLKDGYTMGLGGLMSVTASNGSSKVPVLGDLPLLGYLFKQKTKDETTRNLIIFITTKVISADGGTVQQLIDPRQIKSMGLKKEDLPGYREQTDPFAPEKQPEKKSFWGGKKTSNEESK